MIGSAFRNVRRLGMIGTEREMGPPTIHNLETIGQLEMKWSAFRNSEFRNARRLGMTGTESEMGPRQLII